MKNGSQGSISNYDAPWYDDLTAIATALLYGPSANAQQYSGVEQFTGPQNPFNIPAQAQQGVNTAVEGYDAGNYGQMAMGAGQAGLAVSPLVAMALAARAASAGGIARRLHRSYPNEVSAFHGSPQSQMPADSYMKIPKASNPGQHNNRTFRTFDFSDAPVNENTAQMARISGRVRPVPGGARPPGVQFGEVLNPAAFGRVPNPPSQPAPPSKSILEILNSFKPFSN